MQHQRDPLKVRYRRRRSSHILILLAICAAGAVEGQSVEQLPEGANLNDSSREDEIYTYDQLATGQIIGRLGIPIGSFCTIRGVWIEDPLRFKTTEWWFRVTHVDGNELTELLEYPSFAVINASGGGQEPLADPVVGEVWELRVFEGLTYDGPPIGYWDESRVPPGSGATSFSLQSHLNYVRGTSLGVQ